MVTVPAPRNFQIRVDVMKFHVQCDPVPAVRDGATFFTFVVVVYEENIKTPSVFFPKENKFTLEFKAMKKYAVCMAVTYVKDKKGYTSPYTDYIICHPLEKAIPAPTNLKVRRSFNTIEITWDASPPVHEHRNIDVYVLVRYTKNEDEPHVNTITETKFIDTLVEGGKEYAYSVAALYGADTREGCKGKNFALGEYSSHVKHIFVDYKLSISLTAE